MKSRNIVVVALITVICMAVNIFAGQPPEGNKGREQLKKEQAQMKLEKEKMKKELAEAERQLREASKKIAEISIKMSDKSLKSIDEDFISAMIPRGPRLGVLIETETSPTTAKKGVLLTGVSPGGPAQEAGLKSGDILTTYNGKSLGSSGNGKVPYELLKQYMKGVKEGEQIKIGYLRDGKAGNVNVKVRALGPESWAFIPKMNIRKIKPVFRKNLKDLAFTIQTEINGWDDLQMVELNGDLGKYFGTNEGVLVVSVPEDSKLGLKAGDVISKIGDRKVMNPAQASRILRSYETGENISFTIMRDRRSKVVKVKVPEDKDMSRLKRKHYQIKATADTDGDIRTFKWVQDN